MNTTVKLTVKYYYRGYLFNVISTVARHHVFDAKINGSHARKTNFFQLCTTEDRLQKLIS